MDLASVGIHRRRSVSGSCGPCQAVAVCELDILYLGFSSGVTVCVSPMGFNGILSLVCLGPPSFLVRRHSSGPPQEKLGSRRHSLPIIKNEENKEGTCLGEYNGHHEEIKEEALRNVFVVKVEKDDCETQVSKLVNWVTERCPQ